jgi:hypothetical protein
MFKPKPVSVWELVPPGVAEGPADTGRIFINPVWRVVDFFYPNGFTFMAA